MVPLLYTWTMTKKPLITIAGRPGSGKSTTAKRVAAELGFERFSSGDLFRSIAKENGIDVLQANLSAEDNYEIDYQVDGRLRELNVSADRLVIDSRTAWHWMPSSFKVFLDLDLQTAAERILKDMTPERMASEHISGSPAEYAKELEKRLNSETRRYMDLYEIDPYDMSNYDLVVDTAINDPEQVGKLVLGGYAAWIENKD
jgi:CMP/dCMP kinase